MIQTAPCVKHWALFKVTGCSLWFFFLFLCYAHRFIYKWKYSSDYPLLPTTDELCTLFNWLCVSFNFLTAWSAGSVGPSKVSFDLALCLVSCFTPWACGLLQDSFPHLLLLCLERTQVHFHMYYFTDSYDHRQGEISSSITMCITVALLCSHVNSKEQFIFYTFDTI